MTAARESTLSPTASTAWLASETWRERAFTEGWTLLSLSADVREPATGELMGGIASASPDDIAPASKRARGSAGVGCDGL